MIKNYQYRTIEMINFSDIYNIVYKLTNNF